MRKWVTFFLSILLLWACSNKKDVVLNAQNAISVDTISTPSLKIQPLYNQTPPKIWKLIHTQLELSFNYQKEEVNGMAVLTLRPYFYRQNSLTLDAKSFDFQSILLIEPDSSARKLTYDYNGKKLEIKDLGKYYLKTDTLKLKIKYTAKPTEIKDEGGKAITGAQGLYFINPRGKESNMPTQIWTQGETEYSSCWFPTLDEPNQKTTQEIAVTVPEEYVSLSNGILEFSTENPNGTRTDYWSQSKAHSPYLAMLAIGKFAVVEGPDWRGKKVNYYVEEKYKEDAPFIFKNTHEMMEFYSNLLGVEYPWAKYSQVVVRNFVSGAMENTSATLHGEFVQRHKRELIDYNPEATIAHELFHQWFGDLVSCESWANLPLNEAFATYGEFLWQEYKYGEDEAAYQLKNKLEGYLRESKVKREEWVRFDYQSKDDMFDGHTYSKGARILHMLRTYSGDSAFFQTLNLYLTRYAHGSAEMHQLRLLFEEVTGQDYNWFFDQWAYRSGHPVLNINHSYDSISGNLKLVVKQNQDLVKFPLYQIPFSLEIHGKTGINRYELWLKNEINEYVFTLGEKPILVDFDAEKYILCEKTETKTEREWIYQYENITQYLARYEAIEAIGRNTSISAAGRKTLFKALSDPHFSIRNLALNASHEIEKLNSSDFEAKLTSMWKTDENSKIRAKALRLLVHSFHPKEVRQFVQSSLSDTSYYVISSALDLLAKYDSVSAVVFASQLEGLENDELKFTIATIYSKYGKKSQAGYFSKLEMEVGGYAKVRLIYPYKNFVLRLKDDQVSTDGILLLTKIQSESPFIWVRRAAIDALVEIEDLYLTEKANLEEQKLQQTSNGQAQNIIAKRLDKVTFILDFIDTKFKELEKTETDQGILDAIYKED